MEQCDGSRLTPSQVSAVRMPVLDIPVSYDLQGSAMREDPHVDATLDHPDCHSVS